MQITKSVESKVIIHVCVRHTRMCKTKGTRPKIGKVLLADHPTKTASKEPQEFYDPDSETELVFTVDQEQSPAPVVIGGVSANVVIDSGACSNIMSWTAFTKMKAKGMQDKPCETKRTLYGYGAEKPLTIAGRFTTEVATRDKKVSTYFIVVKCSGPTLLGHKTSPELGLLTLGWVDRPHYGLEEDPR